MVGTGLISGGGVTLTTGAALISGSLLISGVALTAITDVETAVGSGLKDGFILGLTTVTSSGISCAISGALEGLAGPAASACPSFFPLLPQPVHPIIIMQIKINPNRRIPFFCFLIIFKLYTSLKKPHMLRRNTALTLPFFLACHITHPVQASMSGQLRISFEITSS